MILVSPLVIRNSVIFDRIESVMSSPLTYESLISQSGTKKKKKGDGEKWLRNLFTQRDMPKSIQDSLSAQ